MNELDVKLLSSWPAELRLLVHLTREQSDEALKQILQALPKDIDWSKFMVLAKHHRVESIVAHNLSVFPDANIPADVRNHFAAQLRKNSMFTLAIARANIEIIRTLGKKNIQCVLLKGHSVSTRFYQNPHTRECIDVDILVDWENITQARAAVEQLGFKQYFPDVPVPLNRHDMLKTLAGDIAYIRPSDRVQLDLHWRLNRNPHLLNWGFKTVMGFSKLMPLANEKVMVMEPAAQINYMICHGARHAWFRLKWLADIYRMLETLTSDQLIEVEKLSHLYGTQHMLSTSLRLVQDVYGFSSATQEKLKSLTISKPPDHLPYLRLRIRQYSYHKNFKVRDIGDTLRAYRYLSGLRRELPYKKFVIIDFLVNVRDIKTLRLSRKWLWLYVLLSPFLRIVSLGTKAVKKA